MAPAATKQFFMRPMTLQDVPVMSVWFERLTDLSLFDSQSSLPANVQSVEKDWEKAVSGDEPRRSFWFGIEDADAELVGVAGIESVSFVNGDCVLPIILASHVRARGLGIRIAALLIDMAFNQLRLNRVTTYYRSDNKATEKLITALGFTQEGRMRNARFAGGRYHDQVVVGLLVDEWPDLRKTLVKRLDATIELQLGRPGQAAKPWPARPV